MLRAAWSRWKSLLKSFDDRYDSIRRVLERRVQLNRWFPHVPIALALLPLGLVLVYRATLSMLGKSESAGWIEAATNHLVINDEMGVLTNLAVGGLLIVTAYGLAMRARMAWWLAILGLATSLGLRFFSENAAPDHLVDLFRGAVLLALLMNRSHFSGQSVPVQAALGIYAVAMFAVCATVLTLRKGAHFEPEITDATTALYFVVMTVSTVGFGDIVPGDVETQRFVMNLILIGVLVVGSAFSVFLIPLLSNRLRRILGNQENPVNRTRHFIVIGSSSLARNAAVELEKRGQAVTLVLAEHDDDVFYKNRDIVIGDPTDLEVLKAAGTEKARGVLSLSHDDATNGFVVLGVNELSPSTPTVAALNDSRNQSRLERTQPSILLSLQVLGGQLLAMALTGEAVNEDFIDTMLKIRSSPPEEGLEGEG